MRQADKILGQYDLEKVENPEMEMRLKGLVKLTN
jgi:hypothetical protein